MKEVNFEDYQNRDSQYRKYLGSEYKSEDMTLLQKVAVGALLTTGAVAVGYRTGAMRHVSRFLNNEVFAARRAFRETMEQRTSFIKDLRLERLKSDFDTFEKTRRQILEERRSKTLFESREFDMVRYLRQREQLIQKEVPHYIREGLFAQSVIRELRASQKLSEEMLEKVQRAIAKGREDVLRRGRNAEISLLLHREGIDDREIINLVNEIRRSSRVRVDPEEENRWIREVQRKLRESTAEDIQHLTRQDRIFKRTLVGSGQRQATVQDILDLQKSNQAILPENIERQIQDVVRYNKSFKDAIFDENLYVTVKDGKVTGFVDYKPLDQLKRDAMEWWSHTLPGGLLHLRSVINTRQAREQAAFRIFQSGSVQPFLNAHLGKRPSEILGENLVYSGGRFFRLFDDEAINQGKPLEVLNPDRRMILTSARYGSLSEMARSISGIMTDGRRTIMERDVSRSRIMKMLDLGGQERDSIGIEAYSVISKFFDRNWDRRKVSEALRKGIHSIDDYYNLQRFISSNTSALSPRALNQIREHLPENIRRLTEDINFTRDEDVLKLFQRLGENENIRTGYSFNQLYRRYERSLDEVLGVTRPQSQTSIFLGGTIDVKTGIDDIRKEISKEFIRQISEVEPAGMVNPLQVQHQLRNIFKQKQKEGIILKQDFHEAERLINEMMFEQAGRNIALGYERLFTDVNKLLQGTDDISTSFQSSLRQMSREINPLWHKKTNARYRNQVNDEYIAINEADVYNKIQSLSGVRDLLTQLSPLTGRRNLEDVTPLTLYGSYFPAYRLQEALGSLGLGFSDRSMGSTLQLWSSLFLKRGLPIVGLYEGYKYADYLADKYTDMGISKRWELYKAYQELEEAEEREKAGVIDELRRERMLKPGIEHFEAMPSIYIPYVGDIGPGHLLGALLGVPVDERDTMTYEEVYEDILYGTEEVRKGRWWLFGSRTPYRGDRIVEFRPNSYRLAMSDWEYSNVIASAEEQYAHSVFPTLENPLGIFSFLIGTRDPYWFEKKHYYDRPYLLTGAFFNRNTPFLGDIGNLTVGEMIKPTREMHPEYWGNPEIYYEESLERDQRPTEPVRVRVSPAGRVDFYVEATPQDYGARYIVVHERDSETHEPTGSMVITDTYTGQTIFMPKRMNGKYENIEDAFLVAGVANQRSIETRPRGMFEPIYEYQKELDRQKLQELIDPRSLDWQTQEALKNWLEPLGVYNWLIVDEFLGYEQERQKVIARADEATNYSNLFWEQELGSLGGSLSEIGRRFIRRDSSNIEKYNPVRNTMPDWLPGSNYFINFKEGDPYSKIPHGEYRLPGEAYERLNRLHPDEFGRYGAFDRFKILADVAPWSDEYKFWRDYVTEHIEDPELRKQIAEIKRQVSRRKQRYEFYDYMFKDAELEKFQVTVRKFLDDYTFLTEEFGDIPIRLAGVDVRPNAEGVLQQYFDVGDTITIGVDADPNFRISDDTYRTMRAVVFQGIENLNREIIQKGEMKENETDFSAPGVWARFTPEEIAKGARWETIAHFESALNTKFLPVRTALEEYERVQVYGKEFATWADLGLRDYGIPAIERMIGRDSTFLSILSGTMLGGVIGRFIFGGGSRTKGGMIIGGATGLLANLYGKAYESMTGERWIPERRRIEREIEEYFDILKYLKYRGLYERAKQELSYMGYDPDQFFAYIEEKERETKERREELEARKRELYIKQPRGWEKERQKINLELQKIEERWDEFDIPPELAQALYYKEQFEKTLYGIDPYDDRMKVMQAFPYRDRWFFNEFADARTKDREKILELVPENQRRIYKAIWGYGYEPPKPLSYYAEEYNIPGPEWEGWSPEFSLDDIKTRVVLQEGLDPTDMNIWAEDIERAQFVPDIPGEFRNEGFKGFKDVERNIREVLEGRGLRNVQVVVRGNNGTETHTRFTYEEDRQKEIEHEFMYYMDRYVE